MTGGGIVCVQVFEVNHGAGAIKVLRVIDPVAFGLLGICEEVLVALLQYLVENNCHEPVLRKLLFIWEH